LDERRSYWAWTVSSALHGALLVLLLLGFASAPKFEDNPESIPVETVSLSDLNRIMNGEKDAKPAPQPPPRPEPAPAPPEPPPDLRAAVEPPAAPPPRPEPPPPKPEPPPPPPRPAPPPAPKPLAQETPAPPARPKEPPPEKPKQDPIAKAVEREKTEAKPAHVYDQTAIAKLISQPKPSAAAASANPASAPAQGLPRHDAPRMSLSMASALDAWLTESYLNCWTPPPIMPEGDIYVAQIKVVFNSDGSLSARPVLLNPPTDPAWRAHAESAMRAVKKCDPLHVPPQYAPYFEEWRIETIHFDPRETQG